MSILVTKNKNRLFSTDEDTLTIYSDIHITGIGPVSEQDMDYTLDVFFRQR